MGTSVRSISYFDQGIIIEPHTVTAGSDRSTDPLTYIGKRMTIATFAQGQRVSLSEIIETGELIVKREDGTVIEGPEITLPLYKCIECMNDYTRLGEDGMCHHCRFKTNQFRSVIS